MHKWGSRTNGSQGNRAMGNRAIGAIGDLGLSMFWFLGQTGLRTVGTKGPFEALQGIWPIWGSAHLEYYAHLLFHITPYYSINRDTPWATHLQNRHSGVEPLATLRPIGPEGHRSPGLTHRCFYLRFPSSSVIK